MKPRLIYILLTVLLLTGSLGYYTTQVQSASVSHSGIGIQRDAGQLGALIPDLPVPQIIINEDDRDEDDFSSLLRKPVVNRSGAEIPLLYACFNDPLTAFRKNYQRSVFPVSDIYIALRTIRI